MSNTSKKIQELTTISNDENYTAIPLETKTHDPSPSSPSDLCFSIVPDQAWQLLAMFLTTITGLILGPLPVGAWAFLCLTVTVLTKTLTFAAAFSAFTNGVIWLIVASFFFLRGFVKTGLGDRVAMYFVKVMGKSTLGLSYGLVICEAVIGPAVPSTTARVGGIFLPVIKSLAMSVDGWPNDKSSRKLGAYLIQSQLQSGNNSSALFLTSAAQNLLCLKLAEGLGVQINNGWISWFKYAVFPSLISLATTPYLVYVLFPPDIKETPDAPIIAETRLKAMGPVKKIEWAMIVVMIVTVALWIVGQYIDMASVVAAMLGLSLLLVFGVLDWDDCLSEKSAWDTLTWFAILIGMANQLNALGIVKWISDVVAGGLKSMSVGRSGAFFILQLSYFFIHYLLASQTAHVGALYSAFLGMQMAAKVPGKLAALKLGYNTNLFGALTHYSSGQSAVYFGGGYVKLPDVFRLGILVALVNIILWTIISFAWWKLLQLY